MKEKYAFNIIQILTLVNLILCLDSFDKNHLKSGGLHICMIHPHNGRLICWGSNAHDQCNPPDIFKADTIGIAVGRLHTCAYTYLCNLICFGNNSYGQTDIPPSYDSFLMSYSAGGMHSCGIDIHGFVMCWGSGQNKHSYISKKYNYGKRIWSSESMNCVLTYNNDFGCFGDHIHDYIEPFYEKEELYNVSIGNSICKIDKESYLVCYDLMKFSRTKSSYKFLQVDQSQLKKTLESNICVITENNVLNCRTLKGRNYLPDEKLGNSYSNMFAVTVGLNYTCVVKNTGMVICLGTNSNNELDVPDEINASFVQIGIKGSHACTLTTYGYIDCWGKNNYFQLNYPAIIQGHVELIAVGQYFTCATTQIQPEDYDVYCWGYQKDMINYVDAVMINQDTGTRVQSMQELSAGWMHACLLFNYVQVYCWGYNAQGQADPPLGLGKVDGLTVLAIASGGTHTCAIVELQALVCWGSASDNEVGHPLYGKYRAIAAGYKHSCATSSNGVVVCWGSNLDGQQDPVSDHDFESIDCGMYHTCGIETIYSRVICWGSNKYNMFPDYTDAGYMLALGNRNTCLIQDTGSIWCYGREIDIYNESKRGIGNNKNQYRIPGFSMLQFSE